MRQGDKYFNLITTYRLEYPVCCELAKPDRWNTLLTRPAQVDFLCHYTVKMWDILTDVVLVEWFGLRLPPSKLPWGESIYLPDGYRLLYCLDRSYARQARAAIRTRYLSRQCEPRQLSIFAGYGLVVDRDFERERDGLLFLSRQADHFRSVNDYLFVVQDVYGEEIA